MGRGEASDFLGQAGEARTEHFAQFQAPYLTEHAMNLKLSFFCPAKWSVGFRLQKPQFRNSWRQDPRSVV